jgi:hypothetical protein
MSLVSDAGSVPLQVGCVLLLDTSTGLDPRDLVELINSRLPAVSRPS